MKYLHFMIFISFTNVLMSLQISPPYSHTDLEALDNFNSIKEINKKINNNNISEVNIFFYSRNTDNVQVDLTDPSTLKPTDFSISKTTIFLVHGWHDDIGSTLDREVKNAYLTVQDVNVFVVDWSSVAAENYIAVFVKIPEVGKTIGALINDLVAGTSLSMEKVIIVGHSMGAHVAGVAAATTIKKVQLLVGLDPAGPLFTLENKDNRIDITDAKFVQIIHTNAGIQGWDQKLGHADYWPNGGHVQPGCIDDLFGGCAHARSVYYFAESIESGNFVAKNCEDWHSYENGNCTNGKTSWMGQIIVDTEASGNFYLETNDESPFAKG